jgi:hypothetical protein
MILRATSLTRCPTPARRQSQHPNHCRTQQPKTAHKQIRHHQKKLRAHAEAASPSAHPSKRPAPPTCQTTKHQFHPISSLPPPPSPPSTRIPRFEVAQALPRLRFQGFAARSPCI